MRYRITHYRGGETTGKPPLGVGITDNRTEAREWASDWAANNPHGIHDVIAVEDDSTGRSLDAGLASDWALLAGTW